MGNTKVIHRRYGELRPGRLYADGYHDEASTHSFAAASDSLIVFVTHPMITHGEIRSGELLE